MKRYEMIKDRNLFNNIIKTGKFVKDKNFVIYYIEKDDQDFSHFGIAIKNKIGTAVVRNRLKRQVRSIVDNNRNLFEISKYYIIMIRDGCLQNDFTKMNESIIELMKGIKK